MSLPGRASVVIVGGGVMGVSAAFHLAEARVAETPIGVIETSCVICTAGAREAGQRPEFNVA